MKKSDVTLFVILNIFISNCNLITHLFLVTVTNYNYFYFVIKLHNSVTCNYLLPNTAFWLLISAYKAHILHDHILHPQFYPIPNYLNNY